MKVSRERKALAWIETVQSSAAFSLESIHVDKDLICHVHVWEVAWLRRVLRLHPKIGQGHFAFDSQSKHHILLIFGRLRRKQLHHRILASA